MSQIDDKLQRDLKTALLSGDKKRTEVIRGIKAALQYESVGSVRATDGLSEEQSQTVLAREAKKRQEAADLYKSANEHERQQKELYEKSIIEAYLPQKLPEEEIKKVVLEEINKLQSPTKQDMGRIIGQVRGRLGVGADGAVIARLTKEALENR